MCWSVILSTRLRAIEDLFGGMDKVYQVHKRIGRLAFLIIIAHPLCLGADKLPSVAGFLADMWFMAAGGDNYIIGQNIGVAAFLIMALLTALTLWFKPAYHIWKRTHEWFGLVLVLAVLHIAYVDADVAAYPLLKVWVYLLLAVALAAFAYIRFAYRRLGPHADYEIMHIGRHEEILELTLAPKAATLDFKPSQYIYLVVRGKQGITSEAHPYSIASGYSLAGRIKLGVKMAGDHTRSLIALEKGDTVTVYGPYGRFSECFLSAERDCVFIGGGIGITPFMGMWHVALHSEERLDPEAVPERLKRMHPEIIKSWKSPRVSLIYLSRTRKEAGFDYDIQREVITAKFYDSRSLEDRGHQYELYISGEQGRLTAERVDEIVRGGVAGKYIFLCGPSQMIDSLSHQFRKLGVPRERIIVEDFNLV
jgi:predicted ferric reductase